MKLREVNDHTLRDVSVKQCYEWIKTGFWGRRKFASWLNLKFF